MTRLNIFDSAYEGTPPWDIGRAQDAIVQLERDGRIRGRILDAGCGTGYNAVHFALQGHKVLGVDVSSKAIERAVEKARAANVTIDFVCGDVLGVEALNRRHEVPGGAPLVCYYKIPLTIASLVALYRLADFCIVSSLHDGMNLVAKEFVAAREDEDGVLVLSALAGAAQELRDALIINPYEIEGFADALLAAIDMPPAERQARMRAMRRVVAGRDVFGWASDILEGLESLWTKPLHYSVRRWEEMSV
jgi:SAM-dependent methyltransferase